ncbi:MAG: addiction module protein [Planctomycetes bacterium]|nr:addiction module protein [Planctomycetota bacterium]
MTKAAQHVLDEALKLTAEERGALAHDLLVSLDGKPDQDVDAAWAAEAERRARKLLSGEDPGHAWDEVCARLQAEFGR